MKSFIRTFLVLAIALCGSFAFADFNADQEASVVEVRNQYSRMGTAWVYNKTDLVTANHVVEGEPVVMIVYNGYYYFCDVVATYDYMDIAVLRARGANFKTPLKLAKGTRLGAPTIIYGFPERAYFSRTTGHIVDMTSAIGNKFSVRLGAETTAKVRGGYSGGPVVDRTTNEVIGVLTNRTNGMFVRNTNGLFTTCDQIQGLW